MSLVFFLLKNCVQIAHKHDWSQIACVTIFQISECSAASQVGVEDIPKKFWTTYIIWLPCDVIVIFCSKSTVRRKISLALPWKQAFKNPYVMTVACLYMYSTLHECSLHRQIHSTLAGFFVYLSMVLCEQKTIFQWIIFWCANHKYVSLNSLNTMLNTWNSIASQEVWV